jgi:hypothetical protein
MEQSIKEQRTRDQQREALMEITADDAEEQKAPTDLPPKGRQAPTNLPQ